MDGRIAKWILMPFIMLCFSIGSIFLINPIFFISCIGAVFMIFNIIKFSYNLNIQNHPTVYENSVRLKSFASMGLYLANLFLFMALRLYPIFFFLAIMPLLISSIVWYESNKILRHVDEKPKNDHSA
jgi:hypothetical protein